MIDLFQVQLWLFDFHRFGASAVFLFGFPLCNRAFVRQPLSRYRQTAYRGSVEQDPQRDQIQAVNHVPGQTHRGVVIANPGENDQRQWGQRAQAGRQGFYGAAVVSTRVGLGNGRQADHHSEQADQHDDQAKPVVTQLGRPLVTKGDDEHHRYQGQTSEQHPAAHLLLVGHIPSEMALRDSVSLE